MSKLASKIATSEPPSAGRVKRGPDNCCFPLYGEGDLEDWEAFEARRLPPPPGKPLTWREAQDYLDGLAGVKTPLRLDKFKHHWRRFCSCWPDDLRRGR